VDADPGSILHGRPRVSLPFPAAVHLLVLGERPNLGRLVLKFENRPLAGRSRGQLCLVAALLHRIDAVGMGHLLLGNVVGRDFVEVILSIVLKARSTWCSDLRKCLQIGSSDLTLPEAKWQRRGCRDSPESIVVLLSPATTLWRMTPDFLSG
jgi:hypothetical protein